jgi:release factor glutamine methyltransferase
MLKIIDALKLASDFLEKKNIESPRLNSELMLCKILETDRAGIYTQFDKPLKNEELKAYRVLLQRRIKREPLQYILENVYFCGLKFTVDKSVLIPRPETELLVDCVLKNSNPDKLNILDIGCGSGNIGITIAKRLSDSFVTCLDVSQDALNTARKNAESNSVFNIEFVEMDILNNYPASKKYDMIVSNPPYIFLNEKNKMQKEIIDFEPHVALFVDDEMKFFRRICEICSNILKENGRLFFEVGFNQSSNVRKIMEKNNFQNICVIKDLANIDRIIWGEIK